MANRSAAHPLKIRISTSHLQHGTEGWETGLKARLAYDAASGMTTSTLVELDAKDKAFVDYTDLSQVDGIIVVYGYDKQLGSLPARIKQVLYPYAAISRTGKGTNYVSAANNDGCEKCHTDPYLKHGNIYGQVDGDPATDFLTCKACHLDNTKAAISNGSFSSMIRRWVLTSLQARSH
jgi:hypothetical protein